MTSSWTQNLDFSLLYVIHVHLTFAKHFTVLREEVA